MIDRGRKRISLVLNDLLFSYALLRHRAYGDTFVSADRKLDERLVWVMDQQPGMHWSEPFTTERALQVVDELVIRQGADAIVAVNDIFARGSWLRCVSAGGTCPTTWPSSAATIWRSAP